MTSDFDHLSCRSLCINLYRTVLVMYRMNDRGKFYCKFYCKIMQLKYYVINVFPYPLLYCTHVRMSCVSNACLRTYLLTFFLFRPTVKLLWRCGKQSSLQSSLTLTFISVHKTPLGYYCTFGCLGVNRGEMSSLFFDPNSHICRIQQQLSHHTKKTAHGRSCVFPKI